ncbi:MAG TPA: response regulator transcription factor [Solirubrobacterales bacterium]|nr:response regulator transcription factor [Solirubrobacterales bacterium]
MIRVCLVDDHPTFRAGLRALLEASGIEVAGEASGGASAVSCALEHRPDVVLMDLSMPEVDGAEATRRMGREAPDIPVVVLTSFSDRTRITDALDAGAVGYLLKDAEPEDLVKGVEAAAAGQAPLDPRAAREILESRRRSPRADSLSSREIDVLRLVAEGKANKVIAMRLEISEKTVKNHLSAVFQKLDVSDRTQAALWAQRHEHELRGPE